MWFLVRLAFWLSLVIVLLPAAPSQQKTCASQMGPSDAFSAAAAAVSDIRQFCERQPGACATGSQAIVQFEQKAHAGAKMIYQLLNERTGKNVSAVAAAIRAVDDPETSTQGSVLLDRLNKAWELGSREQLIMAANATPSPDFAALMPAVLSAADASDPLARGVLTQAGAELASLARMVLRRLFPESEAVPVAVSGGVFGHSALVRQVFYNSMSSEYPHAVISGDVIEPVQGAVALARSGVKHPASFSIRWHADRNTANFLFHHKEGRA